MSEELFSDELGVCGGDCFIDFTLCHPINSHGVLSCGEGTIPAAGYLNEISPLVSLSVMGFPAVECVHFRVLAVDRRH